MDETAICLFQQGGKGNVFLAKTQRSVQQATRGQRRTYLTLVAFVCDDPRVQVVLPQIIIVKERTIPQRDFEALRATCPAQRRQLAAVG